MIKEEWPLNKCLFTEGLEHNTTRFATPGVHYPSKNCRPTYCRSFQPKHTHTHTHTHTGLPIKQSNFQPITRVKQKSKLIWTDCCTALLFGCLLHRSSSCLLVRADSQGVWGFFLFFFFSFLSVVLFHITLIKPKTAFCMSDSGQQICKRTWSWHSCHWSSNWDLIFLFFFFTFSDIDFLLRFMMPVYSFGYIAHCLQEW